MVESNDFSSDPTFLDDYSTAIKILDGTETADIQTRQGVTHLKAYSYQVFQDFGCLNETEYKTMIGITPPPKSEFPVRFNGPAQPATKMFTIGLEGLAPDKLAAIRKIRISYTDGFELCSNLLQPQDQLLKEQPRNIFKHLATSEIEKRPASWKGKGPDSVATLLRKVAETEGKAAAKLEALAEIEYIEEKDGSGWGSDASEENDVVEKPTRAAGIDLGMLSDDSTTAKRKRAKGKGKGGKSGRGGKHATMIPTTPPPPTPPSSVAPATPATPVTDAASNAPSRKSSAPVLDSEMKFVAEKYVASGSGTSTKSLENLTVEKFLGEGTGKAEKDERSLSGYVRGVTCQ